MSIDQASASPGAGRLRRRIVFELTVEQLPLLDRAEARHGSKRAALLAALHADDQLDQLTAHAADLERDLAKQQTTAQRTATADKKALKLERDLEAAQARIAEHEQALAASRDGASAEIVRLRTEISELSRTLEGLESEVLDLDDRAVDETYCARCNNWITVDGWAWKRSENGGRYAHHRDCGDHAPGLLGASSWLAYRNT